MRTHIKDGQLKPNQILTTSHLKRRYDAAVVYYNNDFIAILLLAWGGISLIIFTVMLQHISDINYQIVDRQT